MLRLFPYRLRLVHLEAVPAVRLDRLSRCPRRLRLASAALVAAAVGCLSVVPATADTSGTLGATITLVTFSLTVSPTSAAYGGCFGGNSSVGALGFPNGGCDITPVTVTNTSTASTAHIDVNGANAAPSDGGTQWVLVAPPVGSVPGKDQYSESTLPAPGTCGVFCSDNMALGNSPICDQVFHPAATDACAATPGQVGSERVSMRGPSSSTDSSPTFTTSITWTAGP